MIFRNLEKKGSIEFKAPLLVATPTHNIDDELKAERDLQLRQKYAGSALNDKAPQQETHAKYILPLYLEGHGTKLCMGNSA